MAMNKNNKNKNINNRKMDGGDDIRIRLVGRRICSEYT